MKSKRTTDRHTHIFHTPLIARTQNYEIESQLQSICNIPFGLQQWLPPGRERTKSNNIDLNIMFRTFAVACLLSTTSALAVTRTAVNRDLTTFLFDAISSQPNTN